MITKVLLNFDLARCIPAIRKIIIFLAENTLLDAHYILSRGSCTGCGLKLECTINVMRVYV